MLTRTTWSTSFVWTRETARRLSGLTSLGAPAFSRHTHWLSFTLDQDQCLGAMRSCLLPWTNWNAFADLGEGREKHVILQGLGTLQWPPPRCHSHRMSLLLLTQPATLLTSRPTPLSVIPRTLAAGWRMDWEQWWELMWGDQKRCCTESQMRVHCPGWGPVGGGRE